MQKTKRTLKKVKRLLNPEYLQKTKYLKYYEKEKVNDKRIILDSQHGNNLNGSIFYILEELMTNDKYNEYEVYVSVNKKSEGKFANLINLKQFTKCHLINMGTREYYKILSSSKYIISDTSLLSFFIKKEEQVYLNVWHGTPLKYLGKGDNTGFHAIGNVQKNFLAADYLLYPNEYMKKHMIEDYMLENICNAKVIMGGYPRNTIFFNEQRQKEVRIELGLENKEVLVYMPTWRGSDDEVEVVGKYLKEIDSKLKDNQILYVNLHPFIGDSIDYKNFKNIKKFPKNYETYEFLSIADILITDYSSVFFDFACTKRKTILFTYDEEEYFKTRGCYMTLDELPFERCYEVDGLINLINKKYDIDYKDFIKEYCQYESIDATKKLCAKVILNEDTMPTCEIPKNNNKNILIYGGSLAKNGLTTALINLLNNVDTKKYNFYVCYNQGLASVAVNKHVIRDLKDGVNYIATTKGTNGTIIDKILLHRFLRGKKIGPKALERLNKIYDYELKRNYADAKFDVAIQYTGYDSRQIFQFTRFKCKKIIFAHSDMNIELSTRFKKMKQICKYAYDLYDTIAVVSESLVEKMSNFVKDKDKIKVVNNIIDYERIIEKGKEEIHFDENTECNVEFDKLIEILNDESKKKFINVGRYSKEKGHERLIKAFYRVWEKNKNVYLIIIGGHGNQYEKTIDLIESLPCHDNIITIKWLSNPFPVVKKCDCFVLSSFYEGFGLCIVEADILGLHTISVDIDGPKKFIQASNGTIVSNNEEGIYEGMTAYLEGKIKKMEADYQSYNDTSLQQFYNLLK